MRILLVEDDPKIASFVLKGLKAEGFAVDHAADGEKGLDLALTEPYAAAIVDVMLPEAERARPDQDRAPREGRRPRSSC